MNDLFNIFVISKCFQKYLIYYVLRKKKKIQLKMLRQEHTVEVECIVLMSALWQYKDGQ